MKAAIIASLTLAIAERERELRLAEDSRNFHDEEADRLHALAAEQESWTNKSAHYQAAVQRRSHAQMLGPRVLYLRERVRVLKASLAAAEREVDAPVPAPSSWSLDAEQAAAVDDTAGVAA